MVKQAVIVAGGRGGRLGSDGAVLPKGLMTIGGEQLVPRSIRFLRDAGVEQIILGTGHLAEQYAQLFTGVVDVVCIPNDRFHEAGSMYTLYATRSAVRGDILLLESDILYEPRALIELLRHPAGTAVLVSHFTQAGDECYVGVTNKGTLTVISKNKADVPVIGGELVGISKISLDAFQAMREVWEAKATAWPTMNYEDALVQAAGKTPVHVHRVDGLVWCEIDTPEHRERAEKLIAPRLGMLRERV